MVIVTFGMVVKLELGLSNMKVKVRIHFLRLMVMFVSTVLVGRMLMLSFPKILSLSFCFHSWWLAHFGELDFSEMTFARNVVELSVLDFHLGDVCSVCFAVVVRCFFHQLMILASELNA